MWFGPKFQAAWTNGFDPAIRKAGYRAFRIDKKDHGIAERQKFSALLKMLRAGLM
jgi:hypothetical protein